MRPRSTRTGFQGFTVIEVLIVLAIAGLVLSIIFLAFPALQRNERNSARKKIVGMIDGQLDQYYTQNSLQYPDLPADMCNFIDNYLRDVNRGQATCNTSYNVPKLCILVTGGRFNICFHDRYNSLHTYMGPLDEVSIQFGHACNPSQTGDPLVSSPLGGDTDVRHFAIWTALEPSGRICQDNVP